MAAEEMTSEEQSLKLDWRKCVSENIQNLTARFKDVKSDKERLELAKDILKYVLRLAL